jgi:regulator of protease activity HflC (stomatin/prohibitin superfamily)
MFEGAGIAVIVLLAVVLFGLLRSIRMVPQGSNYTVERFGRYVRTLPPGLGIIVPFFDRVGHKLSMMERVLDVPSQEVITRDNAMVKVDGVAFFQVMEAAKAAYEVQNLENAILNLVMTNIRTVMGSMDLDSLLSQRDEINHRLLGVVDQAASPWGIKINRIEIKDISPPRDLVDAMARQMKAERDKRASVLEAEGRREAAFRDAEARERAAEAEAKATLMVSEAIAGGNIQAINYFVANNYMKALEALATSPNQKILMLPLEASSVIGSLTGIAEIARETFGGGPSDQTASTGHKRKASSSVSSVPVVPPKP